MQHVELAQKAYQAYGDHVGWKNYAGLPMPSWDALGATIQGAWTAAAAAIAGQVAEDSSTGGPTQAGADR